MATPLHDLFLQALDTPPDRRAAFLAHACPTDPELRAAVESLLAAHDRAGEFLAHPEIPAHQLPADEHLLPGATVGNYRLLRLIGEGGYGTVYLAEQTAPPRTRVALKVIKAGMDTRQVIARFELERKALALMDHSHIARVLDAGATDSGRPFFVMELVDGMPLTDFARERRLPLAQRLGLFADVCDALTHAHQKGIIHRDLKPGNILVATRPDSDRPLAKVIDFGIAKALWSDDQSDLRTTLTQGAAFLGTPQYMSPEQARTPGGDIDSRTDVYSLGVVLYELITGSPPFDPAALRVVSFAEMHRVLREVDPLTPSARLRQLSDTLLAGSPLHAREVRDIARQCAGDLDWITMKALEKDRARRYQGAADLAADIRRFLAEEPVAAGPPTHGYRLRRFAYRHRRGAVSLAALLVLAAAGWAAWDWSAQYRIEILPASTQESPLSPGLQARLFQGSARQALAKTRVDPQVDFVWPRGASPDPALTPPHYSLQWTGILIVPPGGADKIGLNVDDHGSVVVDGIEVAAVIRPGQRLSTLKLAPGRHTLEMDYGNRIGPGGAHLLWQLPSHPLQPIPPTALFHLASPATRR